MITFFTSAKPFRGVTAVQQRNALASWRHLSPENEVILFGRDEGSDSVSAELGLRHIPDVTATAFGTPRLDAMFGRAQEGARHDILCYINADIILMPDFHRAVEAVADWRRQFVMVGHRFDLDFEDALSFSAGWPEALARLARHSGHRSYSNALDYFVFRRGTVQGMPGFAIGRPAWDNWLIMNFERERIPLVDASDDVMAIHQNHGYGHVPKSRGVAWEGPEADHNRALALADAPGFQPHLYTIHSARWRLANGQVRPALSFAHLSWRAYVWSQKRRWPGRLLQGAAHLRAGAGLALFGASLMLRRPPTGWRFCRRKLRRFGSRFTGRPSTRPTGSARERR